MSISSTNIIKVTGSDMPNWLYKLIQQVNITKEEVIIEIDNGQKVTLNSATPLELDKATENAKSMASVKHNKNVHTEHCCKACGCKYGDGEECPVVNGSKKQSNPCGSSSVCNGW